MNHLRNWNHSRLAAALAAAAVFAGMLILNALTPYICDDFSYRLNFMTKEPLGSVWEIIPSMYAHSYKMNGRLIAHGLAQLFMLMDPVVFDLVNAAIFTATLYLAHRLCCGNRNTLLFCAMFCLFWLCTPAFGQVVLWQVGAANYFWSLTACVLFFCPALMRFQTGQDILRKKWQWAAFCIYSFFFGWYNEIASFVGLCMVLCLLLLDWLMNGGKQELYRFVPLLFAAAGYLVMLSAPAQIANKQAEGLTLALLLSRFIGCVKMLVKYGMPLLILFCFTFALGLRARLPQKTLVLSGLFALAGLCANFMPIAASYYPPRCMCTTVLMLLMATGFVAAPLLEGKNTARVFGACLVVLALTVPALFFGCRDIVSCHRQVEAREAQIDQAFADGIRDVTAITVIPETRWSGFWELRDLSPTDPETWPNHDMARYYGLDSLLGS